MAHEEAAQRADGVHNAQAQIAQMPERRDVVGEKPVERIGGRRQREGIEPPPALIALQHIERADILAQPRRIQHRFGQRRGILQAQIQALTGDGMDAMGAIARQRETRPHIIARQMEVERIGPARAHHFGRAQMRAETCAPLRRRNRFVQRQHGGRLVLGFGPDQRRAVSRHGQNREWAGRQEMLIGHAIVRPFMLHGGDDAGLRIGPADHADALRVAQLGIAAIGGDGQRGLDSLAIAEPRA